MVFLRFACPLEAKDGFVKVFLIVLSLGFHYMAHFGPIVSVLAVIAGPLGAQPACPTPQDLVEGIAARDDEGSVTTYRSAGVPGVIRETTLFDDNTGFVVTSQGGLLVQESANLAAGGAVEAGSVVTTSYTNPQAVFPVAEGMVRELKANEQRADGTPDVATEVLIETSLQRRVLYGGCEVAAIPVRLTYRRSDGDAQEFVDFLPAYGISLYLGGGEKGQAPDIYRIVEFSKAPPQ